MSDCEIRGLSFGPNGQPWVICSCGELISMGTTVHRPYWLAHKWGIGIEQAIRLVAGGEDRNAEPVGAGEAT